MTYVKWAFHIGETAKEVEFVHILFYKVAGMGRDRKTAAPLWKGAAAYTSVGQCPCYFCRIAMVSLAIINSSSVGITATVTLESAVEMTASSPRTLFFSGSI